MNRRTILKAIAAVVSAPAGAMAQTHETASSQTLAGVDQPTPQGFGEEADDFGFDGPPDEWLEQQLIVINKELYAILFANGPSGHGARDPVPIKTPE